MRTYFHFEKQQNIGYMRHISYMLCCSLGYRVQTAGPCQFAYRSISGRIFQNEGGEARETERECMNPRKYNRKQWLVCGVTENVFPEVCVCVFPAWQCFMSANRDSNPDHTHFQCFQRKGLT